MLIHTAQAFAAASSPPALAHLEWQTPVGRHCILQRDLERGVEALLAREVFVPSDRADERVDGSIAHTEDGWRVTLTLETHTGHALGVRELSSPDEDCSQLNRALIVVLATLIDAPPEPERPPAQSPVPADAFGFGLAAAVSRSLQPTAAVGVSALGKFAPSRAWPAFWLEAQGFLPQTLRNNAGLGGRFQAFQTTLSACPQMFHLESVDLAACAGAQLGWLRATGLGLAPNREQSRFTAGFLLEPAVSLRLLSHLSARVTAGLSIAFERPDFYFRAADGTRHTIFRPELFGAMVRLGFIVDRF